MVLSLEKEGTFSYSQLHCLSLFFMQAIDYRVEFTKWWVNEFKTIKFPTQGTVFDYYIDTETKQFLLWTERLPIFTLDPDIPLQVFFSKFYIPLLCYDVYDDDENYDCCDLSNIKKIWYQPVLRVLLKNP